MFLAGHCTFWLPIISVFLSEIVILLHKLIRYALQITSSVTGLHSSVLISLSTVNSYVALRCQFLPEELDTEWKGRNERFVSAANEYAEPIRTRVRKEVVRKVCLGLQDSNYEL